MADDVNVGSASIDVRADDSKLKSDWEKIKSDSKKTIEQMNTQLSKIKLSVDASLIDKTFKDVQSMRDKLQVKLAEKIKMNADIGSIQKTKTALDTVQNALRGIETEAKSSNKAVGGFNEKIKDLFTIAATAYVGVKIFDFTKRAVESAAELEVLRSGFKGTEEDLNLLNKSVAGTVTEANLIKLSNQATDLGISLQQQALLFALAENAGDAYGGSVEENFHKIVAASEGMSRGLKSIGIQTKAYENIVKELSAVHGTSIENLDAVTQKQIRLQAIIQASGITIDDVKNKTRDSADQIQNINVKLDTLKNIIGENLIPVVSALIGDLDKLEEKSEKVGVGLSKIEIGVKAVSTFFLTIWAHAKHTANILGSVGGVMAKFFMLPVDLISKGPEKAFEDFNASVKKAVQLTTENWKDYWNDVTDVWKEGEKKFADAQKEITSLGKSNYRNNGETELHKQQREKDIQIEKEYYSALKSMGLISLDEILKNVEEEVTQRYNMLSEAARKEIDLEKWKRAEKRKAEEEYYNQVIKNDPAYKSSEYLLNKDTRKSDDKLTSSALRLDEQISRDIRTAEEIVQKWIQGSEMLRQDMLQTVLEFGNQLESAFGRSGDKFINYLNSALQTALRIADILDAVGKEEKSTTSGFLGIVGSVIGFVGKFLGLREGGTVYNGIKMAEGGTVYNQFKIPSFATGVSSYMVPHGYPNDSYPVFVQSGEDLRVRTPQQRAMAEMDNKALINTLSGIRKAISNINQGGGDQTFTIYNQLDGETIAVNVTRHQNRMLRRGRNLTEL